MKSKKDHLERMIQAMVNDFLSNNPEVADIDISVDHATYTSPMTDQAVRINDKVKVEIKI